MILSVTFSSDQHKLVPFLQDHAFYHPHKANNNHRWTLKGEKKADYLGILGLAVRSLFPYFLLYIPNIKDIKVLQKPPIWQ